jgi:hypothetical protein
MMTAIWYAPAGCFYVTLVPSSSEEQTLVDTLFPQVREITSHTHSSPCARARGAQRPYPPPPL